MTKWIDPHKRQWFSIPRRDHNALAAEGLFFKAIYTELFRTADHDGIIIQVAGGPDGKYSAAVAKKFGVDQCDRMRLYTILKRLIELGVLLFDEHNNLRIAGFAQTVNDGIWGPTTDNQLDSPPTVPRERPESAPRVSRESLCNSAESADSDSHRQVREDKTMVEPEAGVDDRFFFAFVDAIRNAESTEELRTAVARRRDAAVERFDEEQIESINEEYSTRWDELLEAEAEGAGPF